jgi:hypothetical protein
MFQRCLLSPSSGLIALMMEVATCFMHFNVFSTLEYLKYFVTDQLFLVRHIMLPRSQKYAEDIESHLSISIKVTIRQLLL